MNGKTEKSEASLFGITKHIKKHLFNNGEYKERSQRTLSKSFPRNLIIAIEYSWSNKHEIHCLNAITIFNELDLVQFCEGHSKTEYTLRDVIVHITFENNEKLISFEENFVMYIMLTI